MLNNKEKNTFFIHSFIFFEVFIFLRENECIFINKKFIILLFIKIWLFKNNRLFNF